MARRRFDDDFRSVLLSMQGHKCNTCLSCIRDGIYDLDHKVPWCISHDDSWRNMQALCPTCHARKTRGEQKHIMAAKRAISQGHRVCWTCKSVLSAYFGGCWVCKC